ncbi:MAG: alpha/beta hydrolase [Proteobacteria bacterium]|nr:alpha/beta hydrolase [Pseudomonadota bacterium]
MDFRERRITAQDGLSLYVRDYGDPLAARPTVLCLGGISRNARDFELLAPHLASQRRVVCPDYRGRGRSDYDSDTRNYNPSVYLRDILDILTALDLHRVVVIGTSMGGLLAMALASARPGAMCAVVLNDIGPEIEPAGIERIKDYLGGDGRPADWDEAIATLQERYRHDGMSSRDQWLSFAKRIYREADGGGLRPDFDRAIVDQLNSGPAGSPNLWPAFRALSGFPLLAIRGEMSDILSPETFERMGLEKPGLMALTLAGVGHPPTLDEPQSVSAIDDFLDRL